MKYRTAPEVRDVIDAVMWDHHPLISEEGVKIEPVMLDKTPKKAGKDIMGRITKKMGLDAFLGAEEKLSGFSKTAEAFFVMEVSETWWNSLDATQRRALVDHLLCHVQYDEDGDNWRVILPQHGEYPEIVERYGFWRPDTSLARMAVKLEHQLSLLSDEEREDLLKEPEPDEDGEDQGGGGDSEAAPTLVGVGS